MPYLDALGVERRLPLAHPPRRAGSSTTATTSSTTARSTPSSAAPPASTRLARRARARAAWACSSTSCPTTWASTATPTRGGWTCWRTARRRPTRATSTSTGTPVKAELQNKVLLPVLGDQYGAVLEARRARARARGGRVLRPLLRRAAAASRRGPYAQVLATGSTRSRERSARAHPHMLELRSILTALDHLPGRDRDRPGARRRARREKEVVKRAARGARQGVAGRSPAPRRRPSRASTARPAIRAASTCSTRSCRAQAYRLADWRVAGEEINYRRFFDVNDLAAIRMEEPERVRGDARARAPPGRRGQGDRPAHRPPRRPATTRRPTSGGCRRARSSHVARRLEPELPTPPPDALLGRYRAVAGRGRTRRCRGRSTSSRRRSSSATSRCPSWWAVDGTTGYEFLNAVNGLFVDARAERALTASTRASSGPRRRRPTWSYDAKQLIMLVVDGQRDQHARPPARPDRRDEPPLRATSRSTACARALREFIALLPGLPHLRRRPGRRGERARPRLRRARGRRGQAAATRASTRRSSTSSATCCCCACPRRRSASRAGRAGASSR